MLVETWGHRHVDFNVPDFRFFELNRTVYKSTTKRASGGIIVYIRESLINQDSVVFLCTNSDDIIWLRLDDITNLRENLFLCLCYNLPSGTSRQGLNEESIFDRISSYMVHLQSVSDKPCRFIICGDMNARVANMNDFVADDASRHIYALPDDYIVDNSVPRSSKDSKSNSNGNLLIDFCRQTGLRIANGRVGSDAYTGECTYVGSSGTSLVDYVLVSEDLLKCFVTFDVFDPNPISDHCLIEFSLKLRRSDLIKRDETMNQKNKVKGSYKWKSCNCSAYTEKLSSDHIRSKFNEVFDGLDNDSTLQDVDTTVQSFVSIIDDVCKPLFEKPVKCFCKNDQSSSFMYNDDCEIKKMNFYDKLNMYRKNRCDATRAEMVRARSTFKSSVRKFNRECQINKTNKLIKARFKDAKEYWRLLKQSQAGSQPKNLSADIFAEYFKAINDPEDQFYQADDDVLEFNRRFLNSESQVMFAELDVEITTQEIIKGIRELKLGRSGGPDIDGMFPSVFR